MDENLLYSSTRPLSCQISLCFRLFPGRALPPFSPWTQVPSTLSSIPSQEVIIFLEKGPCPTVPKLKGCSLRHTCLAKVLSGRDQCESETSELFPSVLGGLGPLDFSMTLRRVDLTTTLTRLNPTPPDRHKETHRNSSVIIRNYLISKDDITNYLL